MIENWASVRSLKRVNLKCQNSIFSSNICSMHFYIKLTVCLSYYDQISPSFVYTIIHGNSKMKIISSLSNSSRMRLVSVASQLNRLVHFSLIVLFVLIRIFAAGSKKQYTHNHRLSCMMVENRNRLKHCLTVYVCNSHVTTHCEAFPLI